MTGRAVMHGTICFAAGNYLFAIWKFGSPRSGIPSRSAGCFDRVGVACVRQRKVKADKSWKRAFHSFTRAVSVINRPALDVLQHQGHQC
jgi:hypothetical protein